MPMEQKAAAERSEADKNVCPTTGKNAGATEVTSIAGKTGVAGAATP
jgi:hypothetical protein